MAGLTILARGISEDIRVTVHSVLRWQQHTTSSNCQLTTILASTERPLCEGYET